MYILAALVGSELLSRADQDDGELNLYAFTSDGPWKLQSAVLTCV